MATSLRGALAAVTTESHLSPKVDPVPALVAEYQQLFYAACALTAYSDDVPKELIDRAGAAERAALAVVLNTRATTVAGLQAKMRAGNVMARESGGSDDVSTKLIGSCIRDLDGMAECIR